LTSDRKIKANKENARASTGPKTYNGLARSAQNAFSHGLSLPVPLDRRLSAKAAPEEGLSLRRQLMDLDP
jgi:hypothetical protein